MNAKQRRKYRREKGITRLQTFILVRYHGELIALASYLDARHVQFEYADIDFIPLNEITFNHATKAEYDTYKEFDIPELTRYRDIKYWDRKFRVYLITPAMLYKGVAA